MQIEQLDQSFQVDKNRARHLPVDVNAQLKTSLCLLPFVETLPPFQLTTKFGSWCIVSAHASSNSRSQPQSVGKPVCIKFSEGC